jgi:hypothetical protein
MEYIPSCLVVSIVSSLSPAATLLVLPLSTLLDPFTSCVVCQELAQRPPASVFGTSTTETEEASRCLLETGLKLSFACCTLPQTSSAPNLLKVRALMTVLICSHDGWT